MNRNITIVSIVGIVFVVALGGALLKIRRDWDRAWGAHDYGTDIGQVRDLIEKCIRCRLPAHIVKFHMMEDGGGDPTTWIAVQVTPSDLDSIKQQIAESWEPRLDGKIPRAIPVEAVNWWKPSSTNVSVYWDLGGLPASGRQAGGSLWIIDYAQNVLLFCQWRN